MLGTGRTGSVIVTTAIWLAACGGSGGTQGPSKSIGKATPSNDNQSGIVSQQLAQPIRVVVTQGGMPLPGETVTWSVVGQGSIAPGGLTDAGGIATAQWTLGTVAGPQTAHATLTGASGSPLQFNASADPDVPATVAKTATANGDNQTGFINTPQNPLRVITTDQFGNAVSGVTINWAVTSGDATVNPTSGQTPASGIATTTVTPGATAGPITIRATSTPALTGSPIDFSATSAVPPPAPSAIDVDMGTTFFKSLQNSTQNPAVDTLKQNGTVTWHAVQGGHGVGSTGSPSFTGQSSTILAGQTFQVQFTALGTYQYDCIIHGQLMTGRIVVVP
jgi:plastocyanin